MTDGLQQVVFRNKFQDIPVTRDTQTAITVTYAAGAAGTVKEADIGWSPILSDTGLGIGANGGTSLILTTSTFTTEVAQGTKDADLTNGDYWVDYTNGKLRGKKADTATSMTVAFTTYKLNTELTVTGGVSIGSGTAQALGNDAAGADSYATIVTPSADANHILISLEGTTNGALISLDGGSTDHFHIPANTIVAYDWVTITNAVTIQAKNSSAGNNYADLNITIW